MPTTRKKPRKPTPRVSKKDAARAKFREDKPLPTPRNHDPLPLSAHRPAIPGLDVVRREQERRSFARWLPAVSPPPWRWDWPHLQYVRGKLDLVTEGKCKRLMISIPPQHGKLIADDTPIPTPSGWRKHGDLRVGDEVFGRDGNPVRVVATSGLGVASLRVTFTDGASVDCHPKHEWTVYDRSRHRWMTLEAGEMMKLGVWSGNRGSRGGRARFQVDPNIRVRHEEAELPIHPYVLGAWLGDGTTTKPCITHSPSDREGVDRVRDLGYPVSTVCTHKDTDVLTTYFERLSKDLRSTGLVGNKHIPEEYQRASEGQRLQLLAGLIDTDGYVYHENGRVTFSNTDFWLILQVKQLVVGLGWRCSIHKAPPALSTSGIQGTKDVYQLCFNPTTDIPTVIPRKRLQKIDPAVRRRGIESITPTTPKRGKCIQVDAPDGIYLVGETLVPTHNSSLATVRYVAHRIEKDPSLRVCIACYDQKHAKKFSRQVRRICVARGVKMSKERRAVEEWETAAGGYLKAVGVGSGITGNPVDLLVIDDPVKSREEAESLAYRDRVHGWYSEDLYTRLQQDAAIALIGTRWHDDDLIGRISSGEDAPNWDIVNLPAEAEENDPLGRKVGEPLCPDRFDKKALEDRKRTLGNAYYALYQGRPVPRGGVMFLRVWFKVIMSFDRSEVVQWLRYWDLAASTDGDWTAGVRMCRLKSGLFIVDDVVRFRLLAGERDERIHRTVIADGESVRQCFEEEPGSSGKAVSLSIVRRLAGYTVSSERSTGDKQVRAEPWQSQLQGDNVRLLRGHWNQSFIDEHASFPHGRNDDQVDASSGCLNKLAGPQSPYLDRGLLILEGGEVTGQRKSVTDLVSGTPLWVNPDSDDWLSDDD